MTSASESPGAGSWLARSPGPLVIVLCGMAAVRTQLHQPLLELRFTYAVSMVPILLTLEWLGRRAGVSVRALGLAVTAYVLFELLVPPLDLYARIPLLNRFEHFTAFLLLSALVTTASRIVLRRPLSWLQRGVLAFLLFQVGMANEAIEYWFRWGTPFFSEDTVLDITMNTLAISSAQLTGGWWDRR